MAVIYQCPKCGYTFKRAKPYKPMCRVSCMCGAEMRVVNATPKLA